MGHAAGSGIELAAFTDWVVAAPDTQIALPEIGLGLIPGAGGTVEPHAPDRTLAHGVAGVLRMHHRGGDGARMGPSRPNRGLNCLRASSREARDHQGPEEPDGPETDGRWQDAFLYARAWTIAGGSNEIMRNLIAERGTRASPGSHADRPQS